MPDDDWFAGYAKHVSFLIRKYPEDEAYLRERGLYELLNVDLLLPDDQFDEARLDEDGFA